MTDRPSDSHGFSAAELCVTITILTLLVGLVRFGSAGAVEREKLAHIVRVAGELEEACARYRADTGELAYEYTGYDAPHRRLSAAQPIDGWSGPYLEGPLEHHLSNPYGSVHLYNDPCVNGWIPGFDLDGDGAAEVDSEANMLWLSGLDEVSAHELDAAFDANVDGPWATAGRMRYDARQRYAWILVHP